MNFSVYIHKRFCISNIKVMKVWNIWYKLTKIPSIAKLMFNIYPPYLGASIRVKHISDDFREIAVQMPLRFFNRNYVGTHFGGSMYAMVDPFYMFMLLMNLGPEYIVYDSSAEIRYLKPAKGTIRAVFRITEHDIEEIKNKTEDGKPYFHTFFVDILNDSNDIVARVKKVVYVRRKNKSSR